MYINWAHHYIPKISGVCSVFVNFFFIYILQNDKKNMLGNYRYLLLFFAMYNLCCTAEDVLVPMAVHDYRYAFSIFICEGVFEKQSDLGRIFICFRCSFVPAAYAILHSHFVYRYLVLFANNFLTKWFIPYGLLMTISYCLVLMTAWFTACYRYLFADPERQAYIELSLLEIYDVHISDLNVLMSVYQEVSPEAIRDSWIGIIIISFISVYSPIVYVILGALIGEKLNSAQLHMSNKTRKMQQQLMKALAVQAIIPVFVSFLPCLFVWYQPVFLIDIGQWINLTACVAFAMFPVLDPLALFYFIPTFRRRIREIVKKRTPKKVSSILSVSRVKASSSGG